MANQKTFKSPIKKKAAEILNKRIKGIYPRDFQGQDGEYFTLSLDKVFDCIVEALKETQPHE